MGTAEHEQSLAAFLRTVNVGDVLTGTVAEVTRSQTTVLLDAFTSDPVGSISWLDLSWRSFGRPAAEILDVGAKVSSEVIAVDLQERRVRLSRSATENPQLWAYLKALRPGQRLSGTVAAIERFGVFVDLDDGPDHPVFPGVGFITMPELSWRRFEDPSEVVSVGERISCEVLTFDTHNGEARVSLRATQPDPFQQFARGVHVGQILYGPVTKVVPFGAFVRVADDAEGLVHLSELTALPVAAALDAVQIGDEVTVIVIEIDPLRRRLALSRRQAAMKTWDLPPTEPGNPGDPAG
ncbi:S1 RNA-binding domain-containing protein [Streptosporangium canum]|uniref:S1 RNA-binding domain-containing protein n=1 Tax=Streptosporangium canum TaxID=324952 RepID=UPI0033BB7D50